MAMEKLSFLVRRSGGVGWEWVELEQTEEARYRLGGLVMLIEPLERRSATGDYPSRATFATKIERIRCGRKAMFTRVKRKLLVCNASGVANQRVPTSTTLILRKVESLRLRHP